MNWKTVRLTLSTAALAFAVALAAWGLYRITTFEGSHDDASFYLSDGPPFFFWGCLLLFVGYLLRFRLRLYAIGMVAIGDVIILVWKQFALRKQQIDYDFLSEFFLVCLVLLAFMLLDGVVQRGYAFVCRKVRLAEMWRRS